LLRPSVAFSTTARPASVIAASTTRRSSSWRCRSTNPCRSSRSTALVTDVGCTWSSEPSRVIGIAPAEENDSSRSTS
jgi:hypothetical protein